MNSDYKRKTIAAYDAQHEKFAEQYLKTASFRIPDIKQFLKMLHGKRVLDLGSGPGIDATYMRNAGFDIVCVDLSERMVDACHERNLNAKLMDIEAIDFTDASFDGVYAAGSIVHVPKERFEKCIVSVSNALTEKGVLFLSLKQDEGDRKSDYAGDRTFFYWKPEEVEHILKKYFAIEHREVQYAPGQATWIKFFCRKIHKKEQEKVSASVDKTITEYNTHPQKYDELFQGSIERRQKQIEQFTKLLHGKKILDLNGGSGAYATVFKEKGYDVTLTDIAEGLLSIAKKHGIHCIHLNCEELSFDNEFDGIWANAAFVHTEKSRLENIFELINKALKKEGVFYFSVRAGKLDSVYQDKERWFTEWKRDELVELTRKYFTIFDIEETQGTNTRWIIIFAKK